MARRVIERQETGVRDSLIEVSTAAGFGVVLLVTALSAGEPRRTPLARPGTGTEEA